MVKVMATYRRFLEIIKTKKILYVCSLTFALVLFLSVFSTMEVQAGLPDMLPDTFPGINFNLNEPASPDADDDEGVAGSATLQVLFLTVFIILLPSILVVMTSFTRLIIIFSFLRSGLGTQQMPPNTVLIGLALVLTLFIMNPYIEEMTETAFNPLMAGEITQTEAIDNVMASLRRFMFAQGEHGGTNNLGSNIEFFAQLSNVELERDDEGHLLDLDDVPNYILIPAFILHELTVAFAIGVFLFIPFIIIDMVTASVLMAMGMMMLPPVMISLPFKVMLFVLVDGFRLVINTALRTFGGG